MTATIVLDKLEKRFGGAHAVAVLQNLDLTIEDAESYVLLGPSGCGKTTTLRMIAGLEEPTGGDMTIGGTPVYSRKAGTWVPPEQRPIGMVFQSYALWPTMSVAQNVIFTLRHGRSRMTAAAAASRARDVLETMQISHLADRRVTQLSGGQQQRVALARAIAQRPRILLMDEPLSNLDPQLRADVRGEIRKLCKELGITAVIVTHDRDDALGLADRVGVMSDGRILQEAEPSHVMKAPTSLFVARIFGEINTLAGRIEAVEAGGARIRVGDRVVTAAPRDWMEAGGRALVCARPAAQRLADDGLPGTVVEFHREGQSYRTRIDVEGSIAVVYCDGVPPQPGSRVRVAADEDAWLAFPPA